MIIQSIADIPEICFRKGLRRVVISPGSRSAHITLAFAQHLGIEKYVVPDERAAAYIALGMSYADGKPTALICTSGTAGINFYPAITEAYYQQLPLLVFTADRPPEWVDQQDGQTIRQRQLFLNHIKGYYDFPLPDGHKDTLWHSHRIISEAINLACVRDKGPVHINIPIREPFYPEPGETFTAGKNLKIIDEDFFSRHLTNAEWDNHVQELRQFKKILIVAGQGMTDPDLTEVLEKLSAQHNIPISGDVLSNLHTMQGLIRHHDLYCKNNASILQPDLVISFGKSLISKNFKLFLRSASSIGHWHIQEDGYVPDTFQSLRRIFRCSPLVFFSKMLAEKDLNADKTYLENWLKLEGEASRALQNWSIEAEFGEMTATRRILENIPADIDLHLANSMPVRYANIWAVNQTNTRVFSNRGTSGIDGCNSTAVGSALASKRKTLLITGDLAFFYDRNGLWHPHLPQNLKIVIMNNGGGGIFRLIEGPNRQADYLKYFETPHGLTAHSCAEEMGLQYLTAHNTEELEKCLPGFLKDFSKPAILEVFSKGDTNQKTFTLYKEMMTRIT
ncbi:MAG: 2-succinyl-5-enolpyruvyl-6-hydroxy-3-cyclohexene-1-carboxylic-acid synthase [Cyclobacteriaceae bacterium]|nr:2-succinyl-5-enolpyruvyl-6-hydroxy-3-cyclohexene-1-carboxylic-acid synthase [Cyclobacteriaceae bacterium]